MGNTVTMGTHDDFESPQKLTDYLAEELALGRLALFLGAGISLPFGLPAWECLINRLFEQNGLPAPASGDLARQAEFLRNKHFTGDDKGFIQAVRNALYKEVDVTFKNLRKSDTLGAIGALVMASRRGSASNVVTFNFDNLLELYLKYHGFVTHSIKDEIHWNSNADVKIYHPHGYIPFENTDSSSETIILDQKSYSKILGDKGLPWRQQIFSIMRTHTCLFIGVSGNDNNLDSMLVDCYEKHAANCEVGRLYWGISFTTSAEDSVQLFWQNRNVFCKVIANFDNELPRILFDVCQKAAAR